MATTNVNVIEIAELEKVFTDFWGRPRVTAINGITLNVKQGEVFGLLGPNGAGKTTTLKILLGLLFPTSGSVSVLGQSPRDVRIKARIGYLPEESYLYPFLDAQETLDFYGRLFKLDARERKSRTESLLDLVGLKIERRRPIREYSKGMARRIGIAQALINDPDLIILDEPTSGLDPIGNREVKDLILRLKQRGKTILLCSHLLADVEDVCDHIAILYGGKVRRIGTVRELLTRKKITQIAAEGLKESTAEKVVELIRSEEGQKPVSVEHPMTRLEAFFLDVVQEAELEQVETAGATSGRKADNFLTAGTETPAAAPKDILSKLMAESSGEDEPTPSEDAGIESAEPEQEVNRGMLQDLSAGSENDTPIDEEDTHQQNEQVPDSSMLNQLVDERENDSSSRDKEENP